MVLSGTPNIVTDMTIIPEMMPDISFNAINALVLSWNSSTNTVTYASVGPDVATTAITGTASKVMVSDFPAVQIVNLSCDLNGPANLPVTLPSTSIRDLQIANLQIRTHHQLVSGAVMEIGAATGQATNVTIDAEDSVNQNYNGVQSYSPKFVFDNLHVNGWGSRGKGFFLFAQTPQGTALNLGGGGIYSSLFTQNGARFACTSLTRNSSNVATCVTATANNISTGDSISIYSAADTTYNTPLLSGNVHPTVVNSTTFTYPSTGSAGSTTGGMVNTSLGSVGFATGCNIQSASGVQGGSISDFTVAGDTFIMSTTAGVPGGPAISLNDNNPVTCPQSRYTVAADHIFNSNQPIVSNAGSSTIGPNTEPPSGAVQYADNVSDATGAGAVPTYDYAGQVPAYLTPSTNAVCYSTSGKPLTNVGCTLSSSGTSAAAATFTPSAIGWYRIYSGGTGGTARGTITITGGNFNNSFAAGQGDFVVQPYGGQSSINMRIFGAYAGKFGPIDQIEASSDGGANMYLDVHVYNVTSPQPITITFSGPVIASGNIIATPVVGATVGSSSTCLINFGTLNNGAYSSGLYSCGSVAANYFQTTLPNNKKKYKTIDTETKKPLTSYINVISGTVAISTLTSPANCTTGIQVATTCTYKLWPTGAWTTTTSGNISVAITATPGKLIDVACDTGTGKCALGGY